MNKRTMVLVMAGCLMAGTALRAEQPQQGGRPRPPQGPREGRGPMMMEGGDMGEGLLARALAPDSPIAKKLNLTPEQIESLKAVFRDGEKEQAELREKMKQAAVKQAELMAQDNPDEAAVMKGVETIGEIRISMAKIWTHKILAGLKVLTPEQRTTLRETMKEHREKIRDRIQEGREQRQDRRQERRQERHEEGAGGQPPPPGQPVPPPPAE